MLRADPLVHACVLAYLSDISTGVLPGLDGTRAARAPASTTPCGSTRRSSLDEWVLTDYRPRVAGNGRGWYTGSIFTADGALVASLAQETLYR